MKNISLSICIGSVWLYSVHALRLRCPHRIGIGAPFAFRSPTLAPSISYNGSAGGSVLVSVVDSGNGLHTPTQHTPCSPFTCPWTVMITSIVGPTLAIFFPIHYAEEIINV